MNLPIIDTHTDLVIPYQDLGEEFGTKLENTQTSLPLLKKANVKVVFAGFSYDDHFQDSVKQLENIHQMIQDYPEELELVTNLGNLNSLIKSQSIGIVIHLEGGKIIDSVEALVKLYSQGVRCVGLTHNTQNGLGTGATVDATTPLTDLGKKIIAKCNELSVAIDVSHLNEAGFYDVINTSTQPVIASHANCYSLSPNPRNLKDEQLKELAKMDSFVGLFLSGKYLSPKLDGSSSTIDNALAHIEHMVEVMGIDHVAIGSDFGGITTGTPAGLDNHSLLPNLFTKLQEKGYSQEDLEKIAYKNALRVLSQFKAH